MNILVGIVNDVFFDTFQRDPFVDNDFVMKAAVTLLDYPVKLKVSNFTPEFAKKLEANWEGLSTSIEAAFELLKHLGFDEKALRANNAVIPIAYYIYLHRNVHKYQLHEKEKYHRIRDAIKKWLSLALITRQFGGQSDSVIIKTKAQIKESSTEDYFPTDEIIAAFKNDPNKELAIDKEFIYESILLTRKDDADCYPILALIFPEQKHDLKYDKDHLHYADQFKTLKRETYEFLKDDEELYKFYKNPENWDSIANLQLLGESDNKSKSTQSLEEWFSSRQDKEELAKVCLLPRDNQGNYLLSFKKFKDFIEKRRDLLYEKLIKNLEVAQ